MAYGDGDRANRLSGNHVVANLSTADITQAIAYGDSMVNTFTGKSSWTSADPEWASVQTASEYFASSYIRGRFDDKPSVQKQHYDIAMDICDKIRMGTQVLIASPNYRTYPLNEDATIYRSSSGANNSTDDSDLS